MLKLVMRVHAINSKTTRHIQVRIDADFKGRVEAAAAVKRWTIQQFGLDALERNVSRIERGGSEDQNVRAMLQKSR